MKKKLFEDAEYFQDIDLVNLIHDSVDRATLDVVDGFRLAERILRKGWAV